MRRTYVYGGVGALVVLALLVLFLAVTRDSEEEDGDGQAQPVANAEANDADASEATEEEADDASETAVADCDEEEQARQDFEAEFRRRGIPVDLPDQVDHLRSQFGNLNDRVSRNDERDLEQEKEINKLRDRVDRIDPPLRQDPLPGPGPGEPPNDGAPPAEEQAPDRVAPDTPVEGIAGGVGRPAPAIGDDLADAGERRASTDGNGSTDDLTTLVVKHLIDRDKRADQRDWLMWQILLHKPPVGGPPLPVAAPVGQYWLPAGAAPTGYIWPVDPCGPILVPEQFHPAHKNRTNTGAFNSPVL